MSISCVLLSIALLEDVKHRTYTSSAVSELTVDNTNHFIRFDQPKILAKQNKAIPRMVREAIEIKNHPNVNREVSVSMVGAKKYDVAAEAQKMFGESLKSVLMRFRRTADYMNILQDRLSAMKLRLMDIGIQTLYHYQNNLADEVIKLIPGAEEEPTPHTYHYRRLELRSDATLRPAEILDGYPNLVSPLTVEERNSARELGFRQAGEMIHAMISHMGPDKELTDRHKDSSTKSGRIAGRPHHRDETLVKKVAARGRTEPPNPYTIRQKIKNPVRTKYTSM